MDVVRPVVHVGREVFVYEKLADGVDEEDRDGETLGVGLEAFEVGGCVEVPVGKGFGA